MFKAGASLGLVFLFISYVHSIKHFLPLQPPGLFSKLEPQGQLEQGLPITRICLSAAQRKFCLAAEFHSGWNAEMMKCPHGRASERGAQELLPRKAGWENNQGLSLHGVRASPGPWDWSWALREEVQDFGASERGRPGT